MPRRKKISKFNWQDNYAGLILGAIIVVILGLLIANFFSNRNQAINEGANTNQAQEQQQETSPAQYTVVHGDSLSKIAEKEYGSQDMWPVLARVNKIANPSLIYAGNKLEIPPKEQAAQIKTEMSQTTYQVQKGDTLFIIAQKMYGDGSKWHLLDQANDVGRLPNGNPLIFAGNNLKVPR